VRRVLIADDRAQARDALRALLDVKMPVLDGLEATQRIKARWPAIRIVVLTVHAGYRQAALAAGADGFLVKGGADEALLEALVAC
jgi:two-component system response regulator DesR